MKDKIITSLKLQFEAKIEKHKTNIEIMFANPLSIPEHTDFNEAIELELAQLAEYEDKLEALTKHFQ